MIKELVIKNQTMQSDKIDNKRVIYYDVLNILACIAVIFLHCNGMVHEFSNTRLWKEALIIEVICYFAVPIFIMLSGATLLKYREKYTTKKYFMKRIEKVVIPWIAWSLILYVVAFKNLNILNFINYFMYEKIEEIYWFFPLIIYLYCLIPVLSILTEKESYRKTMWGIVVFIFIFQSLLKPILAMLHIPFPNVLNYMTGQSSSIIYLLLGYLLSTTKLNKKTKIILYILAIIALLTRYLHTMLISIDTGILSKESWGYTVFTGLFPTVALFIFIKDIDWQKILNKIRINPKLVSNLASCSFGVYLIHMPLKAKIVKVLEIDTTSYFSRLIFPVIIYFICVGIVLLIKRIPIVKKIVP